MYGMMVLPRGDNRFSLLITKKVEGASEVILNIRAASREFMHALITEYGIVKENIW